MSKAYFFRNVTSMKQLDKKTDIAKNTNARMQSYIIIDKICLTKNEFNNFSNNFIKTYDFINNNSYKLTINNKSEYICLLVFTRSCNFGFLVNSSGYSYARTIAKIKLGEIYGL